MVCPGACRSTLAWRIACRSGQMASSFCSVWPWRVRGMCGEFTTRLPIGVPRTRRSSYRLLPPKIPSRRRTGLIHCSPKRAKRTLDADRLKGFQRSWRPFLAKPKSCHGTECRGWTGEGACPYVSRVKSEIHPLLSSQASQVFVVVHAGGALDELQDFLQVGAAVAIALFEFDGQAHAGIGANHAAFGLQRASVDGKVQLQAAFGGEDDAGLDIAATQADIR